MRILSIKARRSASGGPSKGSWRRLIVSTAPMKCERPGGAFEFMEEEAGGGMIVRTQCTDFGQDIAAIRLVGDDDTPQ